METGPFDGRLQPGAHRRKLRELDEARLNHDIRTMMYLVSHRHVA